VTDEAKPVNKERRRCLKSQGLEKAEAETGSFEVRRTPDRRNRLLKRGGGHIIKRPWMGQAESTRKVFLQKILTYKDQLVRGGQKKKMRLVGFRNSWTGEKKKGKCNGDEKVQIKEGGTSLSGGEHQKDPVGELRPEKIIKSIRLGKGLTRFPVRGKPRKVNAGTAKNPRITGASFSQTS